MGFELTTLVMIGTDCTGSSKFNYYRITATTAHDELKCNLDGFRLIQQHINNYYKVCLTLKLKITKERHNLSKGDNSNLNMSKILVL
jgi:hypothetical protein